MWSPNIFWSQRPAILTRVTGGRTTTPLAPPGPSCQASSFAIINQRLFHYIVITTNNFQFYRRSLKAAVWYFLFWLSGPRLAVCRSLVADSSSTSCHRGELMLLWLYNEYLLSAQIFYNVGSSEFFYLVFQISCVWLYEDISGFNALHCLLKETTSCKTPPTELIGIPGIFVPPSQQISCGK